VKEKLPRWFTGGGEGRDWLIQEHGSRVGNVGRFYGEGAEQRAKEYCGWLNSKEPK
jgi:hypothetical protein